MPVIKKERSQNASNKERKLEGRWKNNRQDVAVHEGSIGDASVTKYREDQVIEMTFEGQV